MQNRTLAAFVLLAALFALVAFACSSSNDDAGNGDDTTGATDGDRASDDATTAADDDADETEEETPTPTPTVDPREAGLRALRNVSGTLDRTTYHVVYDISGSDPSTGLLEGTMTIAASPPKQMFGLDGAFGGDAGAIVVIHDEANAFICIESAADSACLKTQGEGSGPVPLPTILEVDELFAEVAGSPDLEIREVAGRQIAGYDGRCFDVAEPDGSGTVCISEDPAILLFLEGDWGGAAFTLELQSYDPNPPASLFEPPFPVTEIP